MHIKVELKSDLCISSGEGLSGIIDVDVIYDDNGIPYLPAKRFKGILREAAEDISDIYPEKYSQKIINDLFGDPETNSIGELYIDNGYIENYHTIANFIKMCNRNKSYKNLFPKQYIKSYF
ncbi:MAG: RAMP superfamily CRISPR-associated protein, partial [Thermoanaerobacterium sp.]|nr:RAMP superfamily CRISPR-associated protein [Thermoanaerobacterium sp.]